MIVCCNCVVVIVLLSPLYLGSSPLDTSTMFHPISSLRDFTGQKFSMVILIIVHIVDLSYVVL